MCHLQVGRPAPQLNFGLSSSAFKLIFTHKLLSNLEPKTSPSLVGRWDRGWEQGRTGAAGAEMVMVPPRLIAHLLGPGQSCPLPSTLLAMQERIQTTLLPVSQSRWDTGDCGCMRDGSKVAKFRWLGGEGSISWGLGWVYWGFFSSGCGTSTLRQV